MLKKSSRIAATQIARQVVSMGDALETTATIEGDSLLRLDHPLPLKAGTKLQVVVFDESDEHSLYRSYPPGYLEKAPEQRAADIEKWLERLPPGVGLSDWAVSRDSIYD